MKASLKWINQYLRPAGLSAEEADRVLTFAGLPIDSTEALPDGDVRMEVEVTSNRGDCLCHVGWAREIAAAADRALAMPGVLVRPVVPAGKADDLDGYTLKNEARPTGCPRFTLRLIKGVKIGPSPEWLKNALEAVGQRSINNVVDVTNFVLFELGQPSHVFDAGTVQGKALTVRPAAKDEKLELLDGRTITLAGGELVVADGAGPASLAGVMGGLRTAVTDKTADVLLEVATWDPVAVRTAARRHTLRTDSSYRYERTVDPRTMDAAQARLVELILQVAGGTVEEAALDEGEPLLPAENITLRSRRLAEVLGVAVPGQQVEELLRKHGFVTQPTGPDGWTVTVPPHRTDVRLEIDLVEEVARTIGYDKLVVPEMLPVRVEGPQNRERARRELARVLTGLGYFEAVTFSFTSVKQARLFTPGGLTTLSVSDDRRGEEGVLRPSVLTGLLGVRRANQGAKVQPEGGAGVRLYEIASVYGEAMATSGPVGIESRNLALLADLPSAGTNAEKRQAGVRLMTGTIETLVHNLCGRGGVTLRFAPAETPNYAALDPAACAVVLLDEHPIGTLGIITPACQAMYDLMAPVVVAEIAVDRLLEKYPPAARAAELPTLPPVERDLSVIVDERTPWDKIRATVDAARPARMESVSFVGTYRGKPLAEGKKSVTFRMVFRDPERTLRDEEVNGEVDGLIKALTEKVGAELRTA